MNLYLQDEDGIRDYKVTGVQTCALPILRQYVKDLNHIYRNERALHEVDFEGSGFQWIDCNDSDNSEIGRASCRERVWNEGHAGIVNNKTIVRYLQSVNSSLIFYTIICST